MKTKLALILFLAFVSINRLQAQVTVAEAAASDAVASSSDFGSTLSTLANGIKPEAFTNAFNKAGWLEKLKSIKVGDIPSYGKMAGELVSGLKSSSFMKGFDVKKLTNSLIGSKDAGSLAGSISDLTKNLDKSVFTDDFAKNMDTFNSGLDMMKK
jgi:hypothetical protein